MRQLRRSPPRALFTRPFCDGGRRPRGLHLRCQFSSLGHPDDISPPPPRSVPDSRGNDLARQACRVQPWLADFRGLTLGLLAAGVTRICVLPFPPRTSFRADGVSPRQFRRRRWVANRLLRRLFRRPPAVLLTFAPAADFVAADGVHPSAAGWRALAGVIQEAVDASTQLEEQ